MEFIAGLANGFMDVFKAGAGTFASWVAGIIPLIVVLMTAVSSVIKLIGEEQVDKLAQRATQNIITRYTVLPVLAVLFLGNPMCYSFGRFVQAKHKPAFYDAAVSFVHPITGLFPHANGGELFVYMGIAAGITTLGLPLGDLAVRYFLVGIVVIFIRGVVTEKIYAYMKAKEEN
ncbi:PTS system, glucitol/sorbitol-specific IIC component [Propionispira arboris]|uniref:PTS system, glucitol/sorbitol-specific IIC component n=1 Tax=Propionispira arboris TaxID=84035 RepID=A0A1H6Y863_9FIRM|nr:PTS glucitol/sorbitol transporter subunit IIC [Propionispira arboris]SEJ37473.1 PTS system, glucitol/sorbitol-specific IIC component [Propionispira arboris]